MDFLDEFQFWCGEYRDNPKMGEHESARRLQGMRDRGNPFALEYAEESKAPDEDAIDFKWPSEERCPVQGLLTIVEGTSDGYVWNWNVIATYEKRLQNWRCELCGFRCVDSRLIQVHHVDSDKGNNDTLNLQVLCAVCHGKQHASQPLWVTGTTHEEKAQLHKHHIQRRSRV